MKIKKHPKKDLRKWNLPFFQIGLIVALLISWLAIEGKTFHLEETPAPFVLSSTFTDKIEEIEFVQKAQSQPKPVALPQPKLTDRIKISDENTNPDPEPIDLSELLNPIEGNEPSPLDIDQISSLDSGKTKPEDIDPVPMSLVQEVPVFPGCERYQDNNWRFDCLNQQVQKFISRRFDTDAAAQRGIQGMNRINVQFTVDENGAVTQVITKAKDEILEREAHRVIELLPDFQPGKQNNKPVKVIYQVSILLDIQ